MTEIRRLTREDGVFLHQIAEAFRAESTTSKRVESFLKNDLNCVVACIENDKVVGFALAYELERFDRNGMMYVHEVNVLPECRRTGIGSKLMDELKRICQERGLFKIFLITNKSNEPACRLYQTTGAEGTDDDSIVFCYNEASLRK